MTQTQEILKYMQTRGSITQRDALELGVYRLASRICDLRRQGVAIISSRLPVLKADGTITYVARYSLVKEAKE